MYVDRKKGGVNMNDSLTILGVLIVTVIAVAVYLIPTIIAYQRKHHYRRIILGINVIFGLTGLGYLVAFVWAVWPKETAVFDVVTNDPTTNSSEAGQKIYGKMGTNVKAFRNALNSSSSTSPQESQPSNDVLNNNYEDILRSLAKLRDDGIITEEEFSNKKKSILGL
jgi:apolipoprotein N-acyltransferase